MTLKFGWKAIQQTRWSGESKTTSHRFYDSEDDALNDAIAAFNETRYIGPATIRTYAVEVEEPIWDRDPITTYEVPTR